MSPNQILEARIAAVENLLAALILTGESLPGECSQKIHSTFAVAYAINMHRLDESAQSPDRKVIAGAFTSIASLSKMLAAYREAESASD